MTKSKGELKEMKEPELIQYLSFLQQQGYNVEEFSHITNNNAKLRSIIFNTEKQSLPTKKSYEQKDEDDDKPLKNKKKNSKHEQKEDNYEYDNDDCEFYRIKTDCKKTSSSQDVKFAAERCGIDTAMYKTKDKQCDELDKLLNEAKKLNKNPMLKSVDEIVKSKHYQEFYKLDKKSLIELLARKFNITQILQDGLNLVPQLVSKHKLILAIFKAQEDKTSMPDEAQEDKTSMPDEAPPLPTMPPPLPSKLPPGMEDEDEDEDEEMCYELKLSDFMALSSDAVRDLLTSKGLTKGLPKSRERQFYYLCAKSNVNKHCNQSDDYVCPEGLVCDISNDQGLCVDKKEEYEDSHQYKGQTIVGSIESINKVKEQSTTRENLIKFLLRDPPFRGRDKDFFERKSTDKLHTYANEKREAEKEEKKGSEEVSENDEVQENVDIEDLLADVIEGDKDGDELKKTRQYVFKCLGLLSK
jgi:hypothetical protein